MFLSKGKRENHDQTASKDLGLWDLSRLLKQITAV